MTSESRIKVVLARVIDERKRLDATSMEGLERLASAVFEASPDLAAIAKQLQSADPEVLYRVVIPEHILDALEKGVMEWRSTPEHLFRGVLKYADGRHGISHHLNFQEVEVPSPEASADLAASMRGLQTQVALAQIGAQLEELQRQVSNVAGEIRADREGRTQAAISLIMHARACKDTARRDQLLLAAVAKGVEAFEQHRASLTERSGRIAVPSWLEELNPFRQKSKTEMLQADLVDAERELHSLLLAAEARFEALRLLQEPHAAAQALQALAGLEHAAGRLRAAAGGVPFVRPEGDRSARDPGAVWAELGDRVIPAAQEHARALLGDGDVLDVPLTTLLAATATIMAEKEGA